MSAIYKSLLSSYISRIIAVNQNINRLVKNIGGNQNMGEQKVAITDESIGVSQLLGAHARAAPQSLRLCVDLCLVMEIAYTISK